MNLELLLTIIFFIVGGIKWLYEYIKKTNWDKTKFLSEKMDVFYSDEKIKTILTLLDYNVVTIKIGNEEVFITDNKIMEALITHDLQNTFTDDQKKIRDLFDHFFNELSKLQIYIDTKLVRKKDVLIYLNYYLDILTRKNKTKSKIYIKTLRRYIEFYNFKIDFIDYVD